MNIESEYRNINTRDIHVDPLYQRDLDARRVARMAQKFNPLLVNPVKVSFRDGKYYVFDGQHTIALLKSMNKGKDVMAECKVFYGLTRLDEMNLFIAQTGESSPVKIGEKCRALYNNGDPEVTGMVKLVEAAGFVVGWKPYAGTNRISAVRALMTYYRAMDNDDFFDALCIVKKAWGGIPESLTNEILSGVFKFYSAYKGEISKKRLISKLSKENPTVIIRDGRVTASSGSSRYARVVLGIYNRGSTTGRLEDRL